MIEMLSKVMTIDCQPFKSPSPLPFPADHSDGRLDRGGPEAGGQEQAESGVGDRWATGAELHDLVEQAEDVR